MPAASTALPVGVECAAKSRCWRNGGGGGDDCRRKYGSDGDAETDDDERSWTGFFTVIYRVSMLVGLYWMSCMLIDKTNPHSMLILKTGFRTCEISNSLLSECSSVCSYFRSSCVRRPSALSPLFICYHILLIEIFVKASYLKKRWEHENQSDDADPACATYLVQQTT